MSEGSKSLKTFDRVLANPPFSLKNWGYESWQKGNPFGRSLYGCPPKSYGDLAFVQHMIASLKPIGRLGVVLPHGILFRGGTEAKIRQGLLVDDLIEAVIGLASNLFYGTGIPACVLIINKAKPTGRRGKVLVINGAEEMLEGKNELPNRSKLRGVTSLRSHTSWLGFAQQRPIGRCSTNRSKLRGM